MQLGPLLPRLACYFLLACSLAPAALAQSTKIFVASYGNDTNDGSRGSPKRNFQAAHDALTPNGQIIALDTSGYGIITITKSVFINVPPGVNGFITTTGTNNGITINAGASDVVSLRGLIIEGGGTSGGNGIYATSVDTLRVEDCIVRSFGTGIKLTTPATAHLLVQGSSVRDVSDGISVSPTTVAGPVDGVVIGCTVDNATSVGMRNAVNVSDASSRLIAKDCTVTRNGYAGFYANTGVGGDPRTCLDNCTVSGNAFGVRIAGGSHQTRGNNTFTNNGTDGSFNGGTLAPK